MHSVTATRSVRAVRTLAQADPEFVELCKMLYGPMVDPDAVWADAFAKASPDQSEVMSAAERKAQREQRQARLGMASTALGLAAGTTATLTAARDPRFKAGGRVGRAIARAGRKVPDPISRQGGKLGAGLAAGGVGLQALNTAGDVNTMGVLSRENREKTRQLAEARRARQTTAKREVPQAKLADGAYKRMRAMATGGTRQRPKASAEAPKGNVAAPAGVGAAAGAGAGGGGAVGKGLGEWRENRAARRAMRDRENPPKTGRPWDRRLKEDGKVAPEAPRPPVQEAKGASGAGGKLVRATLGGKRKLVTIPAAGLGAGYLAHRQAKRNEQGYYGSVYGGYYAKRDEPNDVVWSGEISKLDDDKRLAFGWASVTEVNGMPVVDRQGDYIAIGDIEDAAYTYVQKSRVGGDMHRRNGEEPHKVGEIVESVVFTPEKIAKMGLPANFPKGWWVGFKVEDDDTWAEVKKGGRTGFSIHGKGVRKDVGYDSLMTGV